MNTKQAWEDAYNAAILETDDGKLPLRVRDAKAAVDARLCAMYQPLGVSREELQALRMRWQG